MYRCRRRGRRGRQGAPPRTTFGAAPATTAYAARDGRIFAWDNPPEHGHPGQEPNCRCWPEPYYGNPSVPDSMLQLVPERRVSTDPAVLWASIETLTRPDGSLAASGVSMNDGTLIQSTFAGSAAINQVILPTGETVRVESRNGTCTIYGDAIPLLQTSWTANGPAVTRTRRQLAFLMDEPLGPDSYFDPTQPDLATDAILDPNPLASLFRLDGPGGPGAVGPRCFCST